MVRHVQRFWWQPERAGQSKTTFFIRHVHECLYFTCHEAKTLTLASYYRDSGRLILDLVHTLFRLGYLVTHGR